MDDSGRARMVDVGGKAATERRAVAEAVVRMSPDTAAVVARGDAPKGDVVSTARIAGIQGAKRTAELSERELELVDAVTRSLVTRLLHEPTLRLRDAAADGPRHLESVRHLFALDADAGETVVRLRAGGQTRTTAAGAA